MMGGAESGSLNYDSRRSFRSVPPDNTFDFLGSNYQSEEDEDYSEKEDLIQNKKFYQKDIFQPFEKSIPKTEIEYLLKQQVSGLECPESPITEHEQYMLRGTPVRNDYSQTSIKPILGKRHHSPYKEFLQ